MVWLGMFSKIHTVPQKMCAIDRDNFQSVEEKKKKKETGKRKKRQRHIPQPDITTTNYYYYILPELEPIPLHIHFLTIPWRSRGPCHMDEHIFIYGNIPVLLFIISLWYFVTKIVLTLLWEKIVLVIEKNFWNSMLKAENLKFFWEL